jgi:hypothetical protein
MGLDLTPRDYLEMLTEEYREYQEHWQAVVTVVVGSGKGTRLETRRYRVSMRKAINCCALSNALPEIIFTQYGDTEPQKVHNAESHKAYRDYLQAQCTAHLTVQDICEFSKHGPTLWRKSVSVQDAKRIKRKEGFFMGLLALTMEREVERLEVRHRGGRTEFLDEILEQVTTSWNVIFDQDKL